MAYEKVKPEEIEALLQQAFPPASPEWKKRVLDEAEARLAERDARRRRKALHKALTIGGVGLVLLAALILAVVGMAVITRKGGDSPQFERPPELPERAGKD